MNVTDERFTSDVNSSTMTLRFTWTNFARDQGDHMVIDDAFNTTRGTWLDGLTENQEADHRITGRLRSRQRSQGGQNAQFHWQGPQQFEPGYMTIEYSGDGASSAREPESRTQ